MRNIIVAILLCATVLLTTIAPLRAHSTNAACASRGHCSGKGQI